ncbi:MAG TPA: hypothetical protein VKA32_08970, partial [Gammaproteobacteria bacterium]|nr:hypothetical protein [Gammaproteobacteria bacterium]
MKRLLFPVLAALLGLLGCGGAGVAALVAQAVATGGGGVGVAPILFVADVAPPPAAVLLFNSELRRIVLSPDDRRLYTIDAFHGTVNAYDASTGRVLAVVDVAGGPRDLAVTPDGRTLFVNVERADAVIPIDTSTFDAAAPIPVGDQPLVLAMAPDGSRLYVANFASNDVSVISVASRSTVGAPVPVGQRPVSIAVTPDGQRLYVANRDDGTVSVIQAGTMTVSDTLDLGASALPGAMAVTPDGARLLVSDRVNDRVRVFSVRNPAQVPADVAVGSAPYALAIDYDGRFAFVANTGDPGDGQCSASQPGTVSVISLDDLAVSSAPVGAEPVTVAVAPDGRTAFVANACDDTVSVLDIADSGGVTAASPIVSPDGDKALGAVLSSSGETLYVMHPNRIRVYAVPSLALRRDIPARGPGPFALALASGENTLVAANAGRDAVALVDTASLDLASSVHTGSRPARALVVPGTARAYVANSGYYDRPGDSVAVVDLSTRTLSKTVTSTQSDVRGPISLAASSDGSRVLVGYFGSFIRTSTDGRRGFVGFIDTATDQPARQEVLGALNGVLSVRVVTLGGSEFVLAAGHCADIDAFDLTGTGRGSTQDGLLLPVELLVDDASDTLYAVNYAGEQQLTGLDDPDPPRSNACSGFGGSGTASGPSLARFDLATSSGSVTYQLDPAAGAIALGGPVAASSMVLDTAGGRAFVVVSGDQLYDCDS